MNNFDAQDTINAVIRFIEEAEDKDGRNNLKFLVNAEEWDKVLELFLSAEIRDMIRSYAENDYSLQNILINALSNPSFLYMLFKEIDNINIFKLINPPGKRFAANNQCYTDEVIIPGNISKLPDSYFSGCKELKRVIFETPSTITELPKGLFLDCPNLFDLQISNKLKEIGLLAVDYDTPNPAIKIKVKKEVPAPNNKWEVEIEGGDPAKDFWIEHVVKG